MKFIEKKPPRSYQCGINKQVTIHDCGEVFLEPDEQLTFKTESGCEYDLARKEWGFYATPSLNGRLREFNLRTVLIRNQNTQRYFILLVEEGKEKEFNAYLASEELKIICWMDDGESLAELEKRLEGSTT